MLGSSVSHLPISSSLPLQAALLFLAQRWFLLSLPRGHSCRDLRERVCTCLCQRWTHSRAHPRWRSRKTARARMDAPPASSSLAPAEASKRSSTTVHSVACAQSRRLGERLSAESPVRLSILCMKQCCVRGSPFFRGNRGCLLQLLKRLRRGLPLEDGDERRADRDREEQRHVQGGRRVAKPCALVLSLARALSRPLIYLFSLSRCTSRITR